MQDRQLIESFLNNRGEAAFLELYRRHTPRLFCLALRFMGNDQEVAQDVVQETWLRAVRNLRDFKWRSSLRTWLCGIVINCCRERTRHLAVQEVELTENLISFAPHNEMVTLVDSSRLEAMIARLSPGYREVLILHDIEGYTHQEIGDYFGISPGTSKSQLSRARRTLRVLVNSGWEKVS